MWGAARQAWSRVKTLLARAAECPFGRYVFFLSSKRFTLHIVPMQCIRSCCSHKGRLPGCCLLFRHTRGVPDLFFSSLLFSFSDGVIQVLMQPLSSVAEPPSPEKKPSSPIKIKRRLTKPWTGSSRTGQLLCQRTNPWPVMAHVCQSWCGRIFHFVPFAHFAPPSPRKADSVTWNEICLLLYDCTSTAEMPARLQTAARGGRDTPQPLLSLCPPSHRVLATGKDIVSK